MTYLDAENGVRRGVANVTGTNDVNTEPEDKTVDSDDYWKGTPLWCVDSMLEYFH